MQQTQHADATRALKTAVKTAPMTPAELSVLVVDSNLVSRDTACQLLKDCSYVVYACGTDLEALELLTLHVNIKLVLKEHEPAPSPGGQQSIKQQQTVDAVQPVAQSQQQQVPVKCDGTRFLRRLARSGLPKVPVVLLSSNGDTEEVVRCLTLGAVDYLVKPLRHNEIKHIWARLWSWKQSGMPIDSRLASSSPCNSGDSMCTESNDDDDVPTSNDGSGPNNNGQGSNGQGSDGLCRDTPGSNDNGSNDNGSSRVKLTEGGGSGGEGAGSGGSGGEAGGNGSGNGSSGNIGSSPSAAEPHASSHNVHHLHRSSNRPNGCGGRANGASSIFLDPKAPAADGGVVADGKTVLPPPRMSCLQGPSMQPPHTGAGRKRGLCGPDERNGSGDDASAAPAHHHHSSKQLVSPLGSGPTGSAGRKNRPISAHNDGSDDTHGPSGLQHQQSLRSPSPSSQQRLLQRCNSGGGSQHANQVHSSGGGGFSGAEAVAAALALQQASVAAALLAQQQALAGAWWQRQQQLQAAAAMQAGGQWGGMPSGYPGYSLFPGSNVPYSSPIMPYLVRQGPGPSPGPYHQMGMPMMHPEHPMAQQQQQQPGYSLPAQTSGYALSQPSFSQASQGAAMQQEPAVTSGLNGAPAASAPVGAVVSAAAGSSTGFHMLLQYMAQTGQVPPQMLYQQILSADTASPQQAPSAAVAAASGRPPASQMFMPPPTPAAAAAASLAQQLQQQQQATSVPAVGWRLQHQLQTVDAVSTATAVAPQPRAPSLSGLSSPSSGSQQILNASCAAILMRLPCQAGPEGRRCMALARYKEKRHNRKFGKIIRYQSRHTQAQQRPRIKGQFVKSLSSTAGEDDTVMELSSGETGSDDMDGADDGCMGYVRYEAEGCSGDGPAVAPAHAVAQQGAALRVASETQDDIDLVEALRHLRNSSCQQVQRHRT